MKYEDEPTPQRVLSIQSHVVSGYVGNKSSVFPLQLLGLDVDVINSVHFSNHTGYEGGVEGEVLNGDQLRSILKGLKRNKLLSNVQHVLTGFIGSESFLEAVIEVIDTIRRDQPSLRFVCDPVLGDHGRFYVPPALVQLYKDKVIPIANVITPNQFEVEQLTDMKVQTVADALRACRALHDMGPGLVFITSMTLQHESTELDKTMTVLASQRRKPTDDTDTNDEVFRMDIPFVEGRFTGTGDLCAALLLGHTATASSEAEDAHFLPNVLEKVMGTMSAVIARTAARGGETVASRELKLVQSKHDIEHPPIPKNKAFRIL